MSRRKDRERFLQLKQRDPAYTGFRGSGAAPMRAPEVTVSAVCSVCGRKRNVPAGSLPEDRGSFVCLTCQEQQGEEPEAVSV